jgi:DNA helicase-2/ATP-dependent DNA helicase PcrA
VPEHLIVNLGPQEEPGEVDLFSERYDVRQSARKNTFTGKTYNSLDNISQFFGDRGMKFNAPKPAGSPARPPMSPSRPPAQQQGPRPGVTPPRPPAPIGSNAGLPRPPMRQLPPAPPPVKRGARPGMVVDHPKYGTGTVVRREGEGDDAKITVNFPRFGLKKLVEKYAGIKRS